jgi:hypothetical protein
MGMGIAYDKSLANVSNMIAQQTMAPSDSGWAKTNLDEGIWWMDGTKVVLCVSK